MGSDNDAALEVLSDSVASAVRDFVAHCPHKTGKPKFAVAEPQKACKALVLLNTGHNFSQTSKIVKCDRTTLARLKSDFADHLDDWKNLGGQVAGGIYFDASDLTSEILQKIADKIDDPDAAEKYSKVLQGVGKTADFFHRHANVARGEATQIVREEKVHTIEDVQEAAEAALKLIPEAEVVE